MKGEKLKGALSRGPKEKPTERLSPGVYRGSKGGLVGQGGQAIRRQPQQQMPQAVAGAASGIRQPGPLPTQASPEQVGQMIAGQPMYQFQMPQPSANMGGKYRLSPGVYGTREQAMQQMDQRVPGLQNGLGQQGNMPPIDWNQMVNYPASMPQQPQQQQQMPIRQQMLRKY